MGSEAEIRMSAPAEVYRRRRARLARRLARPLVVFSGHAQPRNYAANTFPFRPGSHFTYYGGPPVENAALVIEPGSDGSSGCGLYRPPTTPDDVVWMGPGFSDAALAAASGVPQGAIRDSDGLGAAVGGRGAAAVLPLCLETRACAAKLGLVEISDEEKLAIIDQRLYKDEHELAAMRVAAEIGIEAHRDALLVVQAGLREADIVAEYQAVAAANQSQMSFNPIATVRGEILHCLGYGNMLEDGDLFLLDAGVEEPTGYATDITRVVPVSGQWTAIQRHLYNTVERANRQACAACVSGARFRDVHDLAARVICEGLVAAELLTGRADELAARKAHTLFFTHGLGHLIGLDVHDMEDFGDLAGYAPGRERRPAFGDKFLRLDRDLAPGLCLTIEPGIYLVPGIWQLDAMVAPLRDVVNRPKIDALLRDGFGGIRVEHTLCVTEGEPEILTAALPTAADEVAALVGGAT